MSTTYVLCSNTEPCPCFRMLVRYSAVRPASRVVLAHVAEPPGELGDSLAVARLALPLDREVGGLEELRARDEGDPGLAKDFHEWWGQG